MELSNCSRRLRYVSFALAWFIAVSALTPAFANEVAPDPEVASANAHEWLLHGLRVTGLTAANWKPWHLKANYQLAAHGVAPESGTVEEWQTGPDQWRRTYITKNATATEWSVTRARHFQTKVNFPFSPHDLRIATPLIDPLHQAANFKPEYPLDLKPLNAGQALNCVSMASPNRYADGIDPDFLFPRFCFDANPLLRFLGTSDTTVTFNKYQLFQNRGIPYHVEVMVLGQRISSMDITLLEPLASADEVLLKPDAEAVPQPFTITAEDPKPVATYQVGAVTPFAAIHNHTLGTVLVPVLLEKDGRVKVNGSPIGARELGQAAADAIARWRYEPYMVGGEPVEASTHLVYVFDGYPFVPKIGRPKAISPSGYDPKRDPAQDLEQAMAESRQSHKRILIEIGGDWCIWCTYLDQFYADHPDLLTFKQANYVTVRVNVSSENRNRAFLMQYPRVEGVPHIFVLDVDGKLLYSQDTGALEKGNGYSADRVRDFLSKWKPS